jgi:hypothetical protein
MAKRLFPSVMAWMLFRPFLLLLEKSGAFEFVGWWNNSDLAQPIPARDLVDWPMTVIRRV